VKRPVADPPPTQLAVVDVIHDSDAITVMVLFGPAVDRSAAISETPGRLVEPLSRAIRKAVKAIDVTPGHFTAMPVVALINTESGGRDFGGSVVLHPGGTIEDLARKILDAIVDTTSRSDQPKMPPPAA